MTWATTKHRLEKTAWPVAAEQMEPLALLLDPDTYGGRSVAYVETAISHIIYAGDLTIVLRRPLALNGERLLTPHDRWVWCESQADRYRADPNETHIKVLPVARRDGRLHLGGPGEVLDWVLVRSRRPDTLATRLTSQPDTSSDSPRNALRHFRRPTQPLRQSSFDPASRVGPRLDRRPRA